VVASVTELARHLGGDVEGEGERPIEGVAGLAEAGPTDLSFVANRRYLRHLATTQAGAVLIDRKTKVEREDLVLIRCDDPYAAFAHALAFFHPGPPFVAGVDPLASVGEGAVVEGARIEAFAWIGPGATVGAGSTVEAHAYVGAGATVGTGCRLMPSSVVCAGCAVGDRVWLNPGAVVGGEGFGFAPTASGNLKIPQVGRAVIEDDVEIGANSCVDRAAMGETRVRRGAKLDNLVQVGHAATVGEDNLLVAYSGVAGSSTLGKRVTLAAKAAVLGHITLGDGVTVGVASAVRDDQPAGAKITGVPAIPHSQWLRAASSFGELPELVKRIRALEAQLAQLSGAAATPPAPAQPRVELSMDLSDSGIDIDGILAMLPHRYPFLMIDRVLAVVPGESATAIKCVTANEPVFQGHFPGAPIFPGVLLAEAFAQVAGIIALSANPDHAGQTVYLMGLDKIRFRKPVRPGDRVEIKVEKTMARRGIWKFSAVATVDGKKVADGEVMATVADKA